MYIRGLIPRNSTELAEAVPIATFDQLAAYCMVFIVMAFQIHWLSMFCFLFTLSFYHCRQFCYITVISNKTQSYLYSHNSHASLENIHRSLKFDPYIT